MFPSKSTKSFYRREKDLKEILSPSLFPAQPKNSENCITSSKKCDICKNYLITNNIFKLLAIFIMSDAICVVTPVMLSAGFL